MRETIGTVPVKCKPAPAARACHGLAVAPGSHVQRAPVRPAEGGGNALLAFERRRSVWFLLCAAAGAAGQVARQPDPDSAGALPPAIPIFPLQDVAAMLFPDASRPLHIFEPRYREMVADAIAGDRVIGMVMLRPGYEPDYEGNPPIYDIGCAGVISNVERLPDGRYNIVLSGLVKFRVTSEDQSRPYRLAEVDAIPETLDDGDRDALRGHRPLLLELLSFVAPPTPRPEPVTGGTAGRDARQRPRAVSRDDATGSARPAAPGRSAGARRGVAGAPRPGRAVSLNKDEIEVRREVRQ